MNCLDTQCKLTWKPAYQVTGLNGESVCLYSEQEKISLKGKSYLLLAPLLNEGKFDADELVHHLEDQLAPEKVYYALARLEEKNLIQAKCEGVSEQVAAYCQLLKQGDSNRLKTKHLYLTSAEGELPKELVTLLSAQGVQLVDQIDRADLGLMIAKDYLNPAVKTFADEAKNRQLPWMLIKPYGSEIWVGPLFEPGAACYQCLCERLSENWLDLFPPPSKTTLPSTFQLACSLAATEVFNWIVEGAREHLSGKIHTINTIELHQREHLISPCPCCREPKPATPLTLESRKTRDGGFRTLSAEETIKRYVPLVSPLVGVVNYLEPSENVPNVYLSGSNRAISGESKKKVSTFRTHSGGKGTTETAAKASGLCEALERASGVYQGDEPLITASYRELSSDALHPDQVLLFSHKQFQEREKRNQEAHHFWTIPDPFSEEDEIAWSPIWSLTEKRVKYYPTACCYYAYPNIPGKWKFRGDSNGCAAGNCIEEAILQGFLELVERDSIALWWYNKLNFPAVDLESFSNPYIEVILQEHAKHGREVWVLDLTSDLKIPTFAALSRRGEGEIFMGFGTHLDAEGAVTRALTEMGQMLAVGPFWEEESSDSDAKIVQNWMRTATIENQSYLKPGSNSGSSVKSVSDYPKWKSSDLLDDIQHCQSIVESRGMEVLVLDQTRADIGLSVARVIVPGLRHFWPRFAPGRLYDVPVEMGWLNAPRKESELNSIGIFL